MREKIPCAIGASLALCEEGDLLASNFYKITNFNFQFKILRFNSVAKSSTCQNINSL